MLYGVWSYEEDESKLPKADFNKKGPMYVYYDSLSDCRDSKHLTSYTTFNSEACYKSFEQLNNTYRSLVRQDTCDANYTMTTFRDQSKREICHGQKIGTTTHEAPYLYL